MGTIWTLRMTDRRINVAGISMATSTDLDRIARMEQSLVDWLEEWGLAGLGTEVVRHDTGAKSASPGAEPDDMTLEGADEWGPTDAADPLSCSLLHLDR